MTLRPTAAALPRETRDTLFLLLVIGLCVAPLAGHIPPWASVLTLLLLLWRGLLAWHLRPLPARWLRSLLLILVLGLTLLHFRTLLGYQAGVTFIIMLLALKTLELRARRDAMVIFFLGFFTLVANFFFSQSLATALATLAALLGLLTALVNAHLPVGRPPLVQSLRLAARMLLLGAPVMLALFLFFPRIAPLWGLPKDMASGRSGLSPHMNVGSVAQLALDDSIALRLRFTDPQQPPPPQNQMYFRGPVLTAFDGRQWLALNQPEAQAITWARPTPAQLQVSGPALAYEVTLEPSYRPWLLLLDASDQPPELPEGFRPVMTPELQWLASRPITSVLRYRASSHLQFRHGPQQDPRALRPYLQLPAGLNPRTLELAQQLQAQHASPQAIVQAALQRLREGGYRYTLAPGRYGAHTADDFWFERKEGFCEHIASAFAVLMRAAGVPARIVTGYQGGQINNVDGYWTVRQSDAHAWAEVWQAGQGWVRIDPTAWVAPERIGLSQRLQPPAGMLGTAMHTMVGPSTLAHLRALWEATNNRWNQWVLNYTQQQQLNLLQRLGLQAPDWQDLVRVLGLLAALAALLGAGYAAWQRQQHDPWQRLLARTRQRLARAGLALPEHLPPRAMAQQARAHFGAQAEPAAQWLLRLEQARYAPQPRLALAQLQQQWRRLRWPAPPRH
ncbi:protein-glutamine gamma-glutamyltransferase TgpA [Melaminivora sp.]